MQTKQNFLNAPIYPKYLDTRTCYYTNIQLNGLLVDTTFANSVDPDQNGHVGARSALFIQVFPLKTVKCERLFFGLLPRQQAIY